MPSRAGLGVYGEESGESVGFEEFDDDFEDSVCSVDLVVSVDFLQSTDLVVSL